MVVTMVVAERKREKIMPSIMATLLCWCTHSARTNKISQKTSGLTSQYITALWTLLDCTKRPYLNRGWGRDATYKKYWSYMLSNSGQIGTYLTKNLETIINHDRFIKFPAQTGVDERRKNRRYIFYKWYDYFSPDHFWRYNYNLAPNSNCLSFF